MSRAGSNVDGLRTEYADCPRRLRVVSCRIVAVFGPDLMRCKKNARLSAVSYYALVFLPIAAYLGVVALCSPAEPPLSLAGYSAAQLLLAGIVVLNLIILYGVTMFGMVWFGDPRAQNMLNLEELRAAGWDPAKRLLFCFASQGFHEEVLKRSVEQAMSVARSLGVQHSVEVVVDSVVPGDPFFSHPAIRMIRVPESFSTPNQTRFKARSLQYAAQVREPGDSGTWIVHCDEETLVTESAIAGIWKFLREPGSEGSCGAGEIKYNSGRFGLSSFFSLLASLFTGEDLGRYRLQYGYFQRALFGAHGTFIIVPAELERQIQFDFGPRGSITEDLYFAFRAHQLGIPFRWVEGYVREQPAASWRDFFRQRARWVQGAINLICDRRFSLGNRVLLCAYYGVWKLTVLFGIAAVLVMAAAANYGLALAIWGLDVAVMGTILVVGAFRNLQEDQQRSTAETAATLLAVFALTPVVCLMETAASLGGIVAKTRDFHVVRKAAEA